MESGRASAVGLRLLAGLALGTFAASTPPPTPAQTGAPANPNTLRAVTAVNDQQVWAVGDRGTILRSVDGGQTWLECGAEVAISSRQESLDPVASRLLNQVRATAGTTQKPVQQTIRRSVDFGLSCVSFLDSKRGWAVGGTPHSLAGSVRGRILTTEDGGATWQEMPSAGMPLLRRMVMSSQLHGWAMGWPGSLLCGGGFETADGGRSWTAVANDSPPWIDGDRKGQNAVAVAADGWLWRLEQGVTEPAVILERSAAALKRVRLVDEHRGWAVGSDGTLLTTQDGGRSWNAPGLSESQRRLLSGFDFHALAVSEGAVLFAGSPGAAVFRLDPATGELEVKPTGTAATIYDLTVAGGTAWGVGERGLILASVDQGRNWSIQRGGAAEAALLTVAVGANDAAWELHARFAAEEGLATVACRMDFDRKPEVPGAWFVEAALRGGAADAFTMMPPPGQAAPDERVERQVQRLAIVLRQCRPLAVVANQSTAPGANGARIDVHALLDRAVRLAASESELPASSAAGMPPWQTPLVATGEAIGTGDWTLDPAAWLTRTGRTVADHALISRALCGMNWLSPARMAYRLTGTSPGSLAGRNEGLLPARTIGPERRFIGAQPSAFNPGLAGVARATGKAAEIEQLAAASIGTARDRLSWRGQVNLWAGQVDDEQAGVWLAQLALRCLELGRLELASDAVGQLLAGHPRHPLARECALWLASLTSSHEAATTLAAPPQGWNPAGLSLRLDEQVRQAGFPEDPELVATQDGVQHLIWTPEMSGRGRAASPGVVRQASAAESASAVPGIAWQELTARFNQISGAFPELANHPRMLLGQAQLVRHVSGDQAADSIYRRIVSEAGGVDADVLSVARRERMRIDPAGVGPAAPWNCAPAAERPSLDGQLDDDLWSGMLATGKVELIPVRDPDKPGLVRTDYLLLAYDRQFLFCAGRIARVQSGSAPAAAAPAPRERDGLNSRRDHVRIMVDVDRDGAWPFWLAMDETGGLADGVGTLKSWNPQWFVASATEGPAAWTFELAIEWRQLGLAGPPAAGESLGVALSRSPASNWTDGWDTPCPPIGLDPDRLSVPSGGAADYRLLGFGE